jgi:O-antigen ligase
VVVLSVLFYFSTEIAIELGQNKQVSASDVTSHLKSIYNIRTDASNMERVNRWKSALRMFEERPFLGWGPNTYMFTYAAFQSYYDRTVISTNWGDQGNAHSEYIGPLAESGVLGMLSFLAIVVVSLYIGMRLFYTTPDPTIKYWALVILLGLITYYAHGLLNNYLDTDKASIPFWSFLAMLTVLDLQSKKLEQGGSTATSADDANGQSIN